MIGAMNDPGADFLKELNTVQLGALVETMYLVAFADGEYGDEERTHFERCVAMLTEGRMSGDEFDHVIEGLVSDLRAKGRDGVIASLRQRLDSPRLRQIALILAMDMAAADGVLHPNERSFIEALGVALGVNDENRREVIEGPAE